MAVLAPEAGGSAPSRADERRALGVAGAAHVVHDGYTDLLYLLLPVWQAEFGLGYAQVGLLKSCYVAVMAALQVPASLLAERVGPIAVLTGGTVLAATCFLLAGVSAGITTSRLPLSSAPQISSVEASNDVVARCRRTSCGPKRA